MSIPKTIWISCNPFFNLNGRGTFTLSKADWHTEQFRLVDPREPSPLEAVRADLEKEFNAVKECSSEAYAFGFEAALAGIDRHIEAQV